MNDERSKCMYHLAREKSLDCLIMNIIGIQPDTFIYKYLYPCNVLRATNARFTFIFSPFCAIVCSRFIPYSSVTFSRKIFFNNRHLYWKIPAKMSPFFTASVLLEWSVSEGKTHAYYSHSRWWWRQLKATHANTYDDIFVMMMWHIVPDPTVGMAITWETIFSSLLQWRRITALELGQRH